MQQDKIYITLQALQIALFVLGRLLDDMSWYDLGVQDEQNVFEGIAIGALLMSAALNVLRKRRIHGIMTELFVKSQLKFFIAWALQITIVILFFAIFGCHSVVEESEIANFYVDYNGCVLNSTQLLLSLLNYSLLCNTKADRAEFYAYMCVLFAEIIYNGNLLLVFISNLEGQPKEESILLISITVANLILIMDLLFRAAFEEKLREEEKEERVIRHLQERDSFKAAPLIS
jgi:hypothetical protein